MSKGENRPILAYVPAGTTPRLRLDFFGINDQPVTPTAASYTVIDEASGAVVVNETGITPGSETVNLVLPVAATAVIDAERGSETRRVVVSFTHSGGEIGVHVAYFVVEHV